VQFAGRRSVFFSDVYSIVRHNLSPPRLMPLIALEIAPRFRETRKSADRTLHAYISSQLRHYLKRAPVDGEL
jgi:hypothetical protein